MASSSLLAMALCACDRAAPPVEPPPPSVHVSVALPALDAAVEADAAGPRTATVTVAVPPRVAIDAQVHAAVTVVAASGYQINEDFPIRLALLPPAGITMAHPELGRADASAFAPERFELPVALVATEPGDYAVQGTLKFAVCRGDRCVAHDEPLAIAFAAVPP